jgi:hypothetical protein
VALRLWVPDDAALPVALGVLPAEPACENLYSRAMDKHGQALWLLTWEQETKPRVTLPELWDLTHIDIEDTTRQGVVPTTAPPAGSLTVTEDVQFATLPPLT